MKRELYQIILSSHLAPVKKKTEVSTAENNVSVQERTLIIIKYEFIFYAFLKVRKFIKFV